MKPGNINYEKETKNLKNSFLSLPEGQDILQLATQVANSDFSASMCTPLIMIERNSQELLNIHIKIQTFTNHSFPLQRP